MNSAPLILMIPEDLPRASEMSVRAQKAAAQQVLREGEKEV